MNWAHLDLKPLNYFVTGTPGSEDFRIRIGDFGEARRFASMEATVTVRALRTFRRYDYISMFFYLFNLQGVHGTIGFRAPEAIHKAEINPFHFDAWGLGKCYVWL